MTPSARPENSQGNGLSDQIAPTKLKKLELPFLKAFIHYVITDASNPERLKSSKDRPSSKTCQVSRRRITIPSKYYRFHEVN